MSPSIVFICLSLVVGIYFYNNPLRHGPWFLSRRFINWFPLGMTYAFLYMARYNLTVAKNALGSLGAAAANVALGGITWLVLTNRIHVRLLPIFSVTYALNMY